MQKLMLTTLFALTTSFPATAGLTQDNSATKYPQSISSNQTLECQPAWPPDWVIDIEMTDVGKAKLAKVTQGLIGETMGFFIENQLLMEPIIRAEISGGQAVIEGNFSKELLETVQKQLSANPKNISLKHKLNGKWVDLGFTADDIAQAMLIDRNAPKWKVDIKLTPQGKAKLRQITQSLMEQILGIFVNNNLVMAPKVRAVTDQLDLFEPSEAEAQELASKLRHRQAQLRLKKQSPEYTWENLDFSEDDILTVKVVSPLPRCKKEP